jgi:hypothetical protein
MKLLNGHLTKGDAFAVAKIESSLSIRKSIQTGVQLQKMGEQFGFEDTLKLLSRLIENTASFFNLNGNLTGSQLVQISQVIIERYGYDNIEDIILALKNARMGLCEKVYGRIDGEVVLGWIAQYMETKAEEMEKLHHLRKTEAHTIAPEIATAINEAIKQREDQQREYSQAQGTGVIHIDNGNTVDHASWSKWFEANRHNLGNKELKSIRRQLEANNLYGTYNNTITWINERINELSSVHLRGIEAKQD